MKLELADRIARRYQGTFRRAFYRELKNLRGSISLKRLTETVKSRNVEDAHDWQAFRNNLMARLVPIYTEIVETSANEHTPRNLRRGKRLAKQEGEPIPIPATAAQFGFRFDITNPEAVRWIELHAAELVMYVSDITKEAIRALIVRAFEEGIPPQKLARLIREHIGLLPQQEAALSNFTAHLDDLVASEDITAEYAAKRVAQYRDRLLRYRANTIAHNETMTASVEGQGQLWNQMQQQGFIDPVYTRKLAIVTGDERLCEVCAPVPHENGPIPLDQPYQTMNGPFMRAHFHIKCRCTERLVFADAQGRFRPPPPMPPGWVRDDIGNWTRPKKPKSKTLKPRVTVRRKK